MKNVDQLISAIEINLSAARRERRFEDVLDCLDEIFVHHKHNSNEAVKNRCAEILQAA
jgi:hypothetical protein